MPRIVAPDSPRERPRQQEADLGVASLTPGECSGRGVSVRSRRRMRYSAATSLYPKLGTVTIRCECGGSRSIFPRKVEMCASQARPLPT
jgi:hypothetical protein